MRKPSGLQAKRINGAIRRQEKSAGCRRRCTFRMALVIWRRELKGCEHIRNVVCYVWQLLISSLCYLEKKQVEKNSKVY